MDAKDESNCSQAIRTRRLTTLLTGVMCATRTNTLMLEQSLILTLKTSFSNQNNHISEESKQLLLDVVTWTAIIWMTDRLPAIGYIVHKSVPCAKMRHPPAPYPWYSDSPTHDVSNPYPWYIDLLPTVYQTLYPWYIGHPNHGILTNLAMICRTLYP